MLGGRDVAALMIQVEGDILTVPPTSLLDANDFLDRVSETIRFNLM
jgi:hypothetical protein